VTNSNGYNLERHSNSKDEEVCDYDDADDENENEDGENGP
jgi:hypothetical protein